MTPTRRCRSPLRCAGPVSTPARCASTSPASWCICARRRSMRTTKVFGAERLAMRRRGVGDARAEPVRPRRAGSAPGPADCRFRSSDHRAALAGFAVDRQPRHPEPPPETFRQWGRAPTASGPRHDRRPPRGAGPDPRCPGRRRPRRSRCPATTTGCRRPGPATGAVHASGVRIPRTGARRRVHRDRGHGRRAAAAWRAGGHSTGSARRLGDGTGRRGRLSRKAARG